jgi:hypothetical protein
MQALNLMITDSSQLVFIIGMDREKVAAGLALKHEALLPYLGYKKDDPKEALKYGHEFIEKFIQLIYTMPIPSEEMMDDFINDLSGIEKKDEGITRQNISEERVYREHKIIDKIKNFFKSKTTVEEVNGEESSKNETGLNGNDDITQAIKEKRRLNILDFTKDSNNVKRIIKMVAPVFDFNPRRLKQFLNLFRLEAFIANEMGLLDEVDGRRIMTLQQLGKFVAINLKWPNFMKDWNEEWAFKESTEPPLHSFIDDIEYLAELMSEDHGWTSDSPLRPESIPAKVEQWSNNIRLMELLNYTIDNVECRLSNLNIDTLLNVLPVVDRREYEEKESSLPIVDAISLEEIKEKNDGFVGIKDCIAGLIRNRGQLEGRTYQYTTDDMTGKRQWLDIDTFKDSVDWLLYSNKTLSIRSILKYHNQVLGSILYIMATDYGDEIYVGLEGGEEAILSMSFYEIKSRYWNISNVEKTEKWVSGIRFVEIYKDKQLESYKTEVAVNIEAEKKRPVPLQVPSNDAHSHETVIKQFATEDGDTINSEKSKWHEEDKLVNFKWWESSELKRKYDSQGYKYYWSKAEKLADRVDNKGYSIIYEVNEKSNTRYRLTTYDGLVLIGKKAR